jgi:hypothetical protein
MRSSVRQIEKGIFDPDFLRLANIGSDTKNANGFRARLLCPMRIETNRS